MKRFTAGIALTLALAGCGSSEASAPAETTTTINPAYDECETSLARWADYLTSSMGTYYYSQRYNEFRMEVGTESPLYQLIPAIAQQSFRKEMAQGRNVDLHEELQTIRDICQTYVDKNLDYPLLPNDGK